MSNKEFEKARKALGNQMLGAREKLHLTQQEVADAADIHVNYYARIERGQENPSFGKLQSVMRVLKIKSLDLF